MKLKSFRVTNYRSIIDSGVVNIEDAKTIFVGPNEAGKSATLQALQQVNAPMEFLGLMHCEIIRADYTMILALEKLTQKMFKLLRQYLRLKTKKLPSYLTVGKLPNMCTPDI